MALAGSMDQAIFISIADRDAGWENNRSVFSQRNCSIISAYYMTGVMFSG